MLVKLILATRAINVKSVSQKREKIYIREIVFKQARLRAIHPRPGYDYQGHR